MKIAVDIEWDEKRRAETIERIQELLEDYWCDGQKRFTVTAHVCNDRYQEGYDDGLEKGRDEGHTAGYYRGTEDEKARRR